MTLTLDISPAVAARLRADAQGRPVAEVAAEALADVYEDEDENNDALTNELTPVRRAGLPPSHIAAIEEGLADSDAGRVTRGETFFAELRDYALRK